MIKVGLVGIGGMGRMHFNCYKNSQAQVVALCDVDERKRAGEWSGIGLNIDTSKSDRVDLSGLQTYQNYRDLIANPEIDLVDICLPTPQHAEVTIAALRAGKHVFCEKPMAMTPEECAQMQETVQQTGKQLMVGHCLRYWPEYVKTHQIIESGQYGKPLYARFHRSGDTPRWSWNNWLGTASQSGGAVFDMHIHDADTALWWFGKPSSIQADGVVMGDLPMSVDATWRYNDGPLVYLHGSWDNNGGAFRYAFKVVLERATIAFDSAAANAALTLMQSDEQGQSSTRQLEVKDALAYQAEIDDFVACLSEGRKMERVTPQSSRTSVELVLEELRQIRAKNSSTQ